MIDLQQMGAAAKEAAKQLATLTNPQKNALLQSIIDELVSAEAEILAANQEDIALAQAKGMAPHLQDRLLLTSERLQGIIADVKNVMTLASPIGEVFDAKTLDNGLALAKHRIPLGVLGVIYEARPNVSIDIATLALKTSNAVILRGGSETLNSNRALVACIKAALEHHQLPSASVQLIDSADRSYVEQLFKMNQYVDMLIPRGGPNLQQRCIENSTIPVITGGVGICHIYVDEQVQIDKAVEIIINAKVQRPSVCNALDTLLIHQQSLAPLAAALAPALKANQVSVQCDEQAMAAFDGDVVSTEADYATEQLGLSLNIKVVAGINEAIEHIHRYSTEHSEAVLTDSLAVANEFVARVNSAAVYVNASTRFTDGAQFGLGAEVAVSTQKLHARGPMGLEALTSYKWVGQANYLARS